MGNSAWEAKIYLNEDFKTVIKVKNEDKLNDIYNKELNLILPNDEKYYFISNKNLIILNHNNYIVDDVWTNDDDYGYKIDLMTKEYFNSIKSNLINLYLNDFPTVSIFFKKNMSLDEIKYLGGEQINKKNYYFLSSDDILIENTKNIIAKDIIVKDKNGKKKINLVDKNYYKRIQIIGHLRNLEKMSGRIDWLKQNEFFEKMKDFAGEEITQAIMNDLFQKYENNEKSNDKEYINKFLKLLLYNNNYESTRYQM